MNEGMDRIAKASNDALAAWSETSEGRRLIALLRGEPVPPGLEVARSPLPTGKTAAERRLIEMIPEQAGAYLARLEREAAPLPSPEQVAFAAKMLEV